MSTSIQQLSDSIARTLDAVGPAVVHVDGGHDSVSGLVWDDNTIVTVRHAVADDAPITVTLADGSVHTATLIGHDPRLDLSFLTVDDASLPARPTATTETPKLGHLVFTLGRGHRGLRSSMGIVGAAGPTWRTRSGAEVAYDLDIDASLHPTAAGGPLLDASGQLIGINTPALRPGGATIPVATIDASLALVREGGSIRPGLLGVRVRTAPLPPDIAATEGQHQGLLVIGTPRRSPAAKAGIESGDVLLTVAGTPVRALMDLRAALSTAGGTQVTVRILRAGETHELTVPVMATDTLGRRWGRKGGGRRPERGDGQGGARKGKCGPWRRFKRAGKRHPGRC